MVLVAGGEADIEPEETENGDSRAEVASLTADVNVDSNGEPADMEIAKTLPSIEPTSPETDQPTGSNRDRAGLDQSSPNGAIQVDGKVTRYFELIDGKSNKFWEITLFGNIHSVRYGRIGSAGQELTKEFCDPVRAKVDFEKLVRQKTAKGYQETVLKRADSPQ